MGWVLGAHLLLKMWLHLFNGSGETRKACTQVLRVELRREHAARFSQRKL